MHRTGCGVERCKKPKNSVTHDRRSLENNAPHIWIHNQSHPVHEQDAQRRAQQRSFPDSPPFLQEPPPETWPTSVPMVTHTRDFTPYGRTIDTYTLVRGGTAKEYWAKPWIAGTIQSERSPRCPVWFWTIHIVETWTCKVCIRAFMW